jgi:argininosuccinate lyase
MIESKSADMEYLSSHSHYVSLSFKEHIMEQYKDAYVASTDSQVASFNNTINASDIKIVPTYIGSIMHDNVYYKQNIIVEKKSIREQLEDLVDEWKEYKHISSDQYDDILELIDKVEN